MASSDEEPEALENNPPNDTELSIEDVERAELRESEVDAYGENEVRRREASARSEAEARERAAAAVNAADKTTREIDAATEAGCIVLSPVTVRRRTASPALDM